MSGNRAVRRALETSDAIRLDTAVPAIRDTTELITPELALQMLQKNRGNRPINWKRVEDIAKVMKAGTWALTPQGIILDKHENILTGQHRLHAVVKAGVPVYMRVSRGNLPEIAMVLDRGAPQSARDLAARLTERKHGPTESSIVRAIAMLKGLNRPSVDELASLMVDYGDILEVMLRETQGTKKTKSILMVLSAAAIHSHGDLTAAGVLALECPTLAVELEKALAPQTAEQCWGKGVAFSLAMKHAERIVNEKAK